MSSFVTYLKQSDIFYQFTSTQLELVANLCQEVSFDEGKLSWQNSGEDSHLEKLLLWVKD